MDLLVVSRGWSASGCCDRLYQQRIAVRDAIDVVSSYPCKSKDELLEKLDATSVVGQKRVMDRRIMILVNVRATSSEDRYVLRLYDDRGSSACSNFTVSEFREVGRWM